jgi:PCO_ADO
MRSQSVDERYASYFAEQKLRGIFIERRRILRVSVGALAALIGGVPAKVTAAVQGEPRARVSWGELIERVVPLAERLVDSAEPDEEAYLLTLSRLIQHRTETPRASFDLSRPTSQHETLRRLPLLILQFRMTPGALIPCHDHRDYIGALTVTEGAVRIRSFQFARPPAVNVSGVSFKVRETARVTLTAGEQSTLSRSRANIHEIEAGPDGARFIDFFTMFRADAHSAYMNIAKYPEDPIRRIYSATWS